MSKKAIQIERPTVQATEVLRDDPERQLLSIGRAAWWYLKLWTGNIFGFRLPFRSISATETEENVPLPRLPMFWLKAILVLRGLVGNNFIFKEAAARQAAKVLEHLKTHGVLAQDRAVPVYDMRTGSREDFIARFATANTPVVVKGLSDVEHWSIDWLLRTYGDTTVLFTDLTTAKSYEGQLREIAVPNESGEVPYLHNSGRFFEQHPHLLRDLALDKLQLVEGDSFAQQLFVGMKRGSGSPFHCAGPVNLFYQLEGVKRWTFVHPEYSFLLYPYLSRMNTYQTSLVGFPDIGRDYAEVPLFRYCPRFSVDLQKGDVLLSPSWWYHAVENRTERTLAVATRWPNAGQADSNRLYNFLYFHPRRIPTLIGQVIKFAAGRGPGAQTLFEGGAHDDAAADVASGDARRAWGLKAPG